MKHLERSWNSLSDLKNYLETKTKEKVIKFDGVQLVTNKGVYGLAMKELSFRKNSK
jgi:hypothetical protein